MTPFEVGRDYTREQIHDRLGGSRVSCLPTRDGVIVAACLARRFSPRAPHVVLCGQGPRTGPVSDALTRHAGPLPVFVKEAANRWAYQGLFTVGESWDRGSRFEEHVAGSGRTAASVSHVVLLEPVLERAR